MKLKKLSKRIFSKVEITSSCWNWKRAKNPNGYGVFWFNGTMQLAHRFIYELLEGKIPDKLQIDHLCRNRACVNPAHLDIVTQQENVLRGESGIINNAKLKQTKCPQGHLYSGIDNRGYRICRICTNTASQKCKQKVKVYRL